jgi:hypothetical protein
VSFFPCHSAVGVLATSLEVLSAAESSSGEDRLLYSTDDMRHDIHDIHRLLFSRNEALIVLEAQETDERPQEYKEWVRPSMARLEDS